MTGFLEDFFLRSAGVSDQQIAQLNAAWPDLEKAIALAKPHVQLLLTVAQLVITKEKELK